MRLFGAALLMCLVTLLGCGGGAGGGGTIAPGPLSGNWQMTLQSATSTETQSGFLLQTGTVLTGSLLLSGETVAGQTVCNAVGTASGQALNSNVAITVIPVSQTVNLTGTSANNNTSMSGDYSILASGCGQTEVGTWTADLIRPLQGNLQATFTLAGANDFHFTGTITQGPNTGGSTATLAGSMNSGDSPCFTSTSITGVVSGTSVLINFLNSTGVTLGKYAGTMSIDATSINGSYTFSNATDPTALGACQGFRGNATIAVQSTPTK